MKAIQVQQTGGPEVMQVVDLPVPTPKPTEAVIQIGAAGVNFIDVYNREGRYKAPLPLVLGQEAAGVVSAVGQEVRNVKSGDRVAYTGVLGAYAEYAAVPANRLVKIPEGVSDQQAAAAMLQGMTAHYLGRYGPDPCRRWRRGPAPRADGAQPWRTRHRYGFDSGKSKTGPRGWRG